ncbi:hypothetical protein Avbf_01928 [Armadillidium vulgare]|nr:hypothetical protein Avbf_01928 [Armadillidium vulgare]
MMNRYKVEEISAPQGFVGSRLSVLSSLKEHAGEYKCTTFSPLSHSVYILGADESVGTNCGTEDSDTLMLLKSQQCTSLRIVKWQAGSSEATKLLRIAYPLSMECKIAHESDEKLELSCNDE